MSSWLPAHLGSAPLIEALHLLIINGGHILRAKVGNEVSLNTHDVICIDFLAQARVQLLAHISNRKSRYICELLGDHREVVLMCQKALATASSNSGSLQSYVY